MNSASEWIVSKDLQPTLVMKAQGTSIEMICILLLTVSIKEMSED